MVRVAPDDLLLIVYCRNGTGEGSPPLLEIEVPVGETTPSAMLYYLEDRCQNCFCFFQLLGSSVPLAESCLAWTARSPQRRDQLTDQVAGAE